jgi:hypothetical protein
MDFFSLQSVKVAIGRWPIRDKGVYATAGTDNKVKMRYGTRAAKSLLNSPPSSQMP